MFRSFFGCLSRSALNFRKKGKVCYPLCILACFWVNMPIVYSNYSFVALVMVMQEQFSRLSKQSIYQSFMHELEAQYNIAVNAANDAKSHATHDENVAEHKYDTLGLEASYLAEGQSRRAIELFDHLENFKKLKLLDFDSDSPLKLTALVLLKNLEKLEYRLLFIAPCAGGLVLKLQHMDVRVITPASPLGKQLIGAYVGDDVTVQVNHQNILFEVIDVL